MYRRSNVSICPTCKIVFTKSTTLGKIRRHMQLCSGSVVLRSEVPLVPSGLLDVYHGGGTVDDADMDIGGGDMAENNEAVDLPLMVDMFHHPPTGEQERPFAEIFLEMTNNPEAVFVSSVDAPPNDRFMHFQEALIRRGAASNPLNFRNISGGADLDKLFNIFAFVRKYTLSMSAGEYTI